MVEPGGIRNVHITWKICSQEVKTNVDGSCSRNRLASGHTVLLHRGIVGSKDEAPGSLTEIGGSINREIFLNKVIFTLLLWALNNFSSTLRTMLKT